ncbi:DNA-binding protein [Ensifer sp. SSB1]|jgi:predicted DNA-binding transcriptional regulator AlpA|uniref:DNA-binding protein n=1 Tax=Ensifer sp. SSB1 TaxID=2795385 RepID=UPI001A4B330F|nr:DNA-binding protein [Ensifer sp. SSB1]MBK5566903.1 DNA-binding protein [Ensifer sp. SSB1]
MQRSYLTSAQVMTRYSISEMTLFRWQRNEALGFPKPMVVNRRKFFKEEDLTAWERERAKVSA